MERKVCLLHIDGLWFIAKPKEGAVGQFTHEPVMLGYEAHTDAADAAIAYARDNGLPVETREAMIEDADGALAFFATQNRA